MSFRNPLNGKYGKAIIAFLKERSLRTADPRHEFYKAILTSDTFEQYYEKVGDIVVKPDTTSYEVNADMEVKYVLRRGWIDTTK